MWKYNQIAVDSDPTFWGKNTTSGSRKPSQGPGFIGLDWGKPRRPDSLDIFIKGSHRVKIYNNQNAK